MQRQRWRWWWIWVGVLFAGCGQIWSSEGTPPPTRDTVLPLFGYTLLPPSLTPGLWPARTGTPFLAVDGASATQSPAALALAVSGPICTETSVGSLVCLGQVRNMQPAPVERVSVGVSLLALDGTPLMTGEGWLFRWLLPVGASGPYRVLFDSVPPDYAGAQAYIRSGQIAQGASHRYGDIAIQAISGDEIGEQYQVTLTVRSSSAVPVEPVVVTVMLLDAEGALTGFRQVYIEDNSQWQPGESREITLMVAPQRPGTIAFDAFAEGILAQN
ncbi:MAG: hypothetical protein JW910_09050 [Anaerolineae bacterium]|nr:hypothetical protein [Anaerolineae bacterium]